MKTILSILLFSTAIITCTKCSDEKISALQNEQVNTLIKESLEKANLGCKSESPYQSLQWLKDIILKAEEDKQSKKYMGNYIGKIYLTSYKNQPVFHIRMALGSGGIHAYVYDCSGKTVTIEQNDLIAFEQSVQAGTLIYSNMP